MAGAVAGAFLADAAVDRYFQVPGGAGSAGLARWVSRWCDFPPLVVVACLVLGVASLRGWQRCHRVCVAVLLSGVMTGLVGLGVRCLTGRTRPCALEEQGWYGPWHEGRWIVGVHDLNSFPSGHTVFAASMAFIPLVARGGFAGSLALVPFVVAWARLCLGRHHLSDVVVALCLGFAGAWVHWHFSLPSLERWAQRRSRSKLAQGEVAEVAEGVPRMTG